MERPRQARCGGREGKHGVMSVRSGAAAPSGAETVGIPEGLMFFEQKRLWKDFFERLGYAVVFSGRTTNSIVKTGIELCCNETCLPVKVFTGHAASLCGKTDHIFIPRYASVCPHEKSCPKFCGLPDEVRFSLKGRIQPLEITVDFDRNVPGTHESLVCLARRLGRRPKETEEVFEETVRSGLTAEDSPNSSGACEQGVPFIAVLGHPYMIFDDLLSMNLIGKLQKAGYRVMTPYDVKRSVRRRNSGPFLSPSFYETGLDIMGGARALLGLPDLAGMVYLSPFSCGVDSIVAELIERRLRRERRLPFLKLIVDEHSGEAGFDTRLEAFLDMLPSSVGLPGKEIV